VALLEATRPAVCQASPQASLAYRPGGSLERSSSGWRKPKEVPPATGSGPREGTASMPRMHAEAGTARWMFFLAGVSTSEEPRSSFACRSGRQWGACLLKHQQHIVSARDMTCAAMLGVMADATRTTCASTLHMLQGDCACSRPVNDVCVVWFVMDKRTSACRRVSDRLTRLILSLHLVPSGPTFHMKGIKMQATIPTAC
jgi:hypothetical protein